MSVPGRCSSCHREVIVTWHLDGTNEQFCARCIAELLSWPPLLTTEDLMRRLRDET